MPSGYDNRQMSRDSFAAPTRAPVQGTTGGGNIRQSDIRLVGGNSQGGAVASGPQTDAGPIGGELGDYFQKLLQPAIERKQTEEFFKGYTAMQSGAALEEVAGSNKGLSKIFGPSSFQQGAQFYAAKKAVSDWQTELLTDDDLKKLDPADAAKIIAEKSRSMMTGNAGADQIIQSDILQASGPVLATIAKERYAWQQSDAKLKWQGYVGSSASALQTLASKHASLSDPTDEDSIALRGAVQQFRSGMAQPEGMADETYRDGLLDFMVSSMEAGNFYAVEVMRQSGIDQIFDDEKRTKIENAYEKYGQRVLNKAAGSKWEELATLEAKTELGQISPLDAGREKARINGELKRETGIDLDLFDYKDQVSAASSVTRNIVAAMRRTEDRQWQIEDRERTIQAKREDDAAEEARDQGHADTIFAMGTAAEAVVIDPKLKSRFDEKVLGAYKAGDYTTIARNFNGGFVSTAAAGIMQANVTASIGDDFSKASAQAYKEWSALNATSPAAASAYYGKYNANMLAFNRLRQSGYTDQHAWVRAFSPDVQSTADIPPSERKNVGSAIDAGLSDRNGWFGFGEVPLNPSSTRRVKDLLFTQVAVAGKNSGLGYDTHGRNALKEATVNGSLEIYDQFAIINKPNTMPLYKMLGLRQAEGAHVIKTAMAVALKRAGFQGGLDGDNYDILRLRGPDGKPALSIMAIGEDGEAKHTVIPFAVLQATAKATAANTTIIRNKTGVDPYRRIPGESGWQRVTRINKEVAAGASPTRK